MTCLILPLQRLSFIAFAIISGIVLAGIFLLSLSTTTNAFAQANDKCFATFDGSVIYSSSDAEAIRTAISVANPGQSIRIAGTCAGVKTNEVIAITKTLTLIGGYTITNWLTPDPILNSTIIDASGAGRVVSASTEITLSNVTLQNGKLLGWGKDGAGLYALQNVTLSNVILYSNSITYSATFSQYPGDGPVNLGGGAYIGGVATLSHTQFVSNSSQALIQYGGVEYRFGTGGGAYFSNAASLTDTEFLNNKASYGGGAFFAHVANLYQTDFISNTAVRIGGAIFNQAGYLTQTNFIANSADYGGGAYFGKEAVIVNISFVRNQANFNTGGALFLGETGRVVLKDVIFAENRANEGSAGGGYFYGYTMPQLSNVIFISNTANMMGGAFFDNGAVITDSQFIGNRADLSIGGGGFSSAFGAETTLISTSFTQNVAGNEAGGAAFGGPANIFNANFVSNAVTGTNAVGVGGASFWGSITSLSNTTFLNNKSSGIAGGALFSGETIVTNTTFVNNSAGSYGGGVYIDGNYLNATHKIFVNTLFAKNTSVGVGAAVYVQNRTANQNTVSLIHATIANPTLANVSAVAVASSTLNITDTIIASYTVGLERLSGTINENYNLFSAVALPYSGTIPVGVHSFSGEVAFFDTTAYTLTSASVAIDAGANVGVSFDYFGVSRPQWGGFDIGYSEARDIVRYLLRLPIIMR